MGWIAGQLSGLRAAVSVHINHCIGIPPVDAHRAYTTAYFPEV